MCFTPLLTKTTVQLNSNLTLVLIICVCSQILFESLINDRMLLILCVAVVVSQI